MPISSLDVGSVFAGGLSGAADLVVEQAIEGRGGYACLANAHVLATAARDAEVRRALEGAWRVFPDGWPVACLQRRLGEPHATRVAGPDLMPLVFERGRGVALRHFLFGSTRSVLDRLDSQLHTRYPGVKIVGKLAPEVGNSASEHSAATLAQIAAARPHVVWCALGAPKQERWMYANADALAPAVCLGVGAAFDFLSGTKPRAPLWIQTTGLEWLHRLVTEPLRLGPRYLRTNGAFMRLAVRALLAGRGQDVLQKDNAESA